MKRRLGYGFTILTAMLLASTPLFAQYWYEQEPPRWRLNGDLGFDFSRSTLSSHGLGDEGKSATNQPGGTVDANLSGFLFNPLLLSFNAMVNELQASSVSSGGFVGGQIPSIENRTGALSYSFNGTFLSGRAMPLTFHYVKTDAGLSSSLLHQNQGTREYGFEWRPRLPHIRTIYAGYRDSTGQVAIPTSFFDTNNSQKIFRFYANDALLGWNWNATFSRINQEVSSLGATVLPTDITEHAWNESFDIRRDFWDQLLTVSAGENVTRDHSFSGAGRNEFNLLGYHAGLFFRPTDKLTAGVNYSHEEFESGLAQLTTAPGSGPVAVLSLPLTRMTSVGGHTNYQPFGFLNLNGSLTYIRSDYPSVRETLEKTLTPAVTATVTRQWRGFEFNGMGGFGYHMTTSNLGRQANAPAYQFGLNLAHGSVQRFRWTGGFQSTHDVLPQMIGSFTNTRRATLTGETMRFADWRLTGGIDYTRFNTLTIGGQFKTNGIGFNVGAAKQRYGLRFYRSYSSGVGAIFPALTFGNDYLITLPVAELVGSPLLNRTTHSTGLSGYYTWHRWLVNGTFSREHDLLSQSHQQFNYLNIDAQYSLGKFTLTAGYSRNLLDVTPLGSRTTGTTYNRFHFRVTRAFKVF